MLKQHIERYTDGVPTTLLFTVASGSRLYETNWHKAHWRKAREKAGLSLRFHDYADLRVMPTPMERPSNVARGHRRGSL